MLCPHGAPDRATKKGGSRFVQGGVRPKAGSQQKARRAKPCVKIPRSIGTAPLAIYSVPTKESGRFPVAQQFCAPLSALGLDVGIIESFRRIGVRPFCYSGTFKNRDARKAAGGPHDGLGWSFGRGRSPENSRKAPQQAPDSQHVVGSGAALTSSSDLCGNSTERSRMPILQFRWPPLREIASSSHDTPSSSGP